MEVEIKFSTSPMRSLLAYALRAPVAMLMSELDRLVFCGETMEPASFCVMCTNFMQMKPKAKHVILNQLALMCNLTECHACHNVLVGHEKPTNISRLNYIILQ